MGVNCLTSVKRHWEEASWAPPGPYQAPQGFSWSPRASRSESERELVGERNSQGLSLRGPARNTGNEILGAIMWRYDETGSALGAIPGKLYPYETGSCVVSGHWGARASPPCPPCPQAVWLSRPVRRHRASGSNISPSRKQCSPTRLPAPRGQRARGL